MRTFVRCLFAICGLLGLSNLAFALAPVIVYNTTNSYTVGTMIPTLSPTVTNGVTAFGYGTGTAFGAVANPTGLFEPWDMDIDATNNVYVADYGNRTIRKYTAAGVYTSNFGTGIPNAGTYNPVAIAFDPTGNAYVLDDGNNRVIKLNAAGAYQSTLVAVINNPRGLAIDAAGNVYIGDSVVPSITKYNGTTGAVIFTITGGALLNTPDEIAIDPITGNFYVANRGGNNILVYTSAGAPVGTGIFKTGLNGPYSVATDGVGNVYVENTLSSIVNVYNSAGTLLGTRAITANARGLVVDAAGDLIVSDFNANSVTKYPPNGGFQLTTGTLPAGLSFDSSTGKITGTPTAVFPQTNFQVTAYNASGAGVSNIFTIQCSIAVPTLTYTAASDVYGTALPTTTPNYGTGGTPTACTITPTTANGGLSVTAAGVVTGTPKLSVGQTVGTITYTITNSNAGGAGVPAIFTVTVSAAPLLITATNQTKVYGSANPTLTVTYTTLVNGDTPASLTTQPTVSTTATTTSVPGSYPITATGAVDGNYTITYAAGSLTVTPKALTITGLTANSKPYDGTATATLTGGTLNGVVSPDMVTLNVSGTFPSKNVGTGLIVTSTSTLSGANAGNYTLTQPTGITANITALPLTVTGLTANDKIYDGTTAATFTGGTLSGVLGSDVVTLVASGTFPSKNIGTGLTVTSTSTLGGADGGNYTLTQPTGFTANITAKTLTITGLTAANKMYDGTATATFTGGTLVGVVSPDVVTFATSGTFPSPSIGTGLAVTSTTTLGGAGAGNYILTQPTGLTANITVKTLTITGLTANNKPYDGTATATFTGGTLNGVVSPDVVTFSASGTFPSKNVGTGLTVTSTSTLSGANAGNYTLTQPTGITANITALPLTVTGLTPNNKIYDGTTTATFTGGTLSGVLGSDVVTLVASGTFPSKNIGTGLTVTSTSTLGGSGGGNYILTQPTGLTANITAKALTITGLTAANKVYDGTTTATFTGGTLVGVVSPDAVTFTASGTFSSSSVGTGLTVTSTTTLGGAGAGNYTLTQPTGLTANITVKTLTMTGLAANNKVYDGTTTATFTTPTLNGVVSPDVVTVTTTGTFASKNVGTGIAVSSNSVLGGANAGNYTVTQITGLKANITQKPLSITGLTANNKVYDGTTAATFSGGSLVGVVSPDVVTFTTAGTFASSNVANGIAVSSTCTLGGAGAGNYSINPQPSGLTANITPAPLTITAVNQTRDVGIYMPFTVTYSGFVNGESSANLTTQPTITSTGNTLSPVGMYPITASGAAGSNYTITYVAGTLTITAPGTHTYTWDWTAASNTTWENPANWDIGGVPQITNYPGSATNTDIADIGVNILYNAANNPVISGATVSVTSINFGSSNNATNIGLTVNGTLNTSSDITLQAQNLILGNNLNINLSGSGTISVPNLNVINNQTFFSGTIASINTSVANLNVTGNITLTTTVFFLADIGSNFTVTGGTTTVGGVLTTLNNPGFFAATTSTFSVNPTTTATLNLTNANAMNLDNATSVIDFDHPGSTVNYTGTAASQTVYTNSTVNASTGVHYRNLTISGTGTGVPLGGTLTVDQNMVTSGTTNFGTNAPTVTVAGNWTNTANVTQGASVIAVTGGLINNSNTITGGSGTLTAGTMTLNGGNLNGGAGAITAGGMTFSGGNLTAAAGTVTCTGTYLNNGGILNCGTAANASVIFKGTYTNNSGTLTANPTSTSAVFFSGANQNLTDNTTAGTLFNNVTFNGTNTAMQPGTGNFGVASVGTLTLGTGTQLTAGSGAVNVGYLTLLSNAASTATVAAIPTGAKIAGAVNVQRFITGGAGTRGYRLLTSPVNISGSTSGAGNLTLSYLNTNASFGGTTYLGAFTEGPGTGFTYNGSFNPIIYLYDESRPSTDQGFTAGKNIGIYTITTSNSVVTLTSGVQSPTPVSIPVGNSYLFYYVGDNHDATQGAVVSTRIPESIPITATGYINQGNVPVKFWNTGTTSIPYDVTTGTSYPGLNQVGNPYPSTISLDVVASDNAAVNKVFWELVPGGSYVSYAVGGAVSDARASKYVVSGQGFLVEAQAKSETLTFQEHEKVAYPTGFMSPFNTATSTALLMDIKSRPDVNNSDVVASTDRSFQALLPSTNALTGLHLQLTKDSLNFVQTGFYFGAGNNDKYAQNEDAVAVNGSGAKVFLSSYSSDNVNVGINQVGDYSVGKRIKMYAGVTSSGEYTISLADIANIDTVNYNVFLIDKKMNDSLDMVRYKSYAFNINNSDTSTYGANRFVLVIERIAVPKYSLISFNGAKVSTGVKLTWTTLNAGNYTGYILQKLDSKGNFNPLYTAQSDNSETSYSYVDQSPVIGNNTYRLAQIGINGQITYSNIITVKYNKIPTVSGLTLYPNPSNSIINVIYNDGTNANSSSKYSVDIFNSAGTFIKHESVNANTWTEDVSAYKIGVYILQLKDNNGQLIGQTKFIRNL